MVNNQCIMLQLTATGDSSAEVSLRPAPISVKKQFDEGKNLSDKQVAALARLAEKYRKKQDR